MNKYVLSCGLALLVLTSSVALKAASRAVPVPVPGGGAVPVPVPGGGAVPVPVPGGGAVPVPVPGGGGGLS